MDLVWKSTRTIENTITEFPLFSFLWGIPPHVLAIGTSLPHLPPGLPLHPWQTLSGGRGRALPSSWPSRWDQCPLQLLDVLVYAPFTLLILAVCLWQAWKAGRGRRPAYLEALVLVPVASVPSSSVLFQMAGSGFNGSSRRHTL